MPFSVSICVHVALGVVDNETQLFTNEEQWTRNDGFECYHLSMLPCRDPGPIPDERIPSPCAILFNSFATLHHLTNRNSASRAHGHSTEATTPAVPLLGFVSGFWSHIAPPSALLLPRGANAEGAWRDSHTI